MWIFIVSVIVFIVICFVINLIDKNKEKLIDKFKIEQKEVMKCPICQKEYEDLELQFCDKCNTSLNKHTKYNMDKKLKRKLISISLICIAIIVVIVIAYIGISNHITEQKRIEKYNNDLEICYSAIDELNWDKAKELMKEHSEEGSFEYKAYRKLEETLDKKIETIKNGKDDEEFLNKLETISKTESRKKIKESYIIADLYTKINKVNSYIQKKEYEKAYVLLETIMLGTKEEHKEIYNLAKSKQDEIKDNVFKEILSKAKKEYDNKQYEDVISSLKEYKDLGNKDIKDLYNKADKEQKKIEEEKRKKEEEERRKQEEKERKEQEKKEKEEKARKKKRGVDIGMTQQDVLDSMWGEPESINRTVTAGHVYEQWVYGYPNYLYFTDGILTSIQN